MDLIKQKSITRKSFVKTMACAVAGCACFQLHSFAIDDSGNISKQVKSDQNSGDKEKLVAICGMYCGACPSYIITHSNDEERQKALLKQLEQFLPKPMKLKAEDFVCDGCKGDGRIYPGCRSCATRSCSDKKKVARCSDCPDFPCSRITDSNKTGMACHGDVLHNLEQVRNIGINKWAKYEEERWQCPKCHSPISWIDTKCLNCGAPRSERLFPAPQVGKQL
jgi:hypothetical protein